MDWREDRMFVLETLKRNEVDHANICSKLDELIKSNERLKVRSGVWGALAGLLPVVGGVIFILLRG